MSDFMDTLATDARATVDSGYYEHPVTARHVAVSLRNSICQSTKAPVIAEVKGASPSKGTIRRDFSPEKISQAMARGGAVGISVLTEPKHFSGSLHNLARIRESVNLPLLMKDIVVSPRQLDAAAKVGANVVLLIQAIFDRGYCLAGLGEIVGRARQRSRSASRNAYT